VFGFVILFSLSVCGRNGDRCVAIAVRFPGSTLIVKKKKKKHSIKTTCEIFFSAVESKGKSETPGGQYCHERFRTPMAK
jgi:hypothetical protein